MLKHPENLDLKRHERARLEEALKLNESLATAYYLNEDLRELWNQSGKSQARCFLQSRYLQALASGIRVIQQFARTLLAHAPGILAWYDHPHQPAGRHQPQDQNHAAPTRWAA